MKRLKFMHLLELFFLFLASAFPTCMFAQDDLLSRQKKMSESFKIGILKDFTPKGISADSVSVNSTGPFFMVAGIDRPEHFLDVRPKSEKEKIIFSLKSGSGNFVLLNDPETKQGGQITATPDSEGIVEVLFYPDSKSPSGEYSINVITEGNPGIHGELLYQFNISTTDEKKFDDVCKKSAEVNDETAFLPRDEKLLITENEYDQSAVSVTSTKSENYFKRMTTDGTSTLFENDETGKKISENKRIQDDKNSLCFYAVPWGESDQDLIYLHHLESKDPRNDIWDFYFFDKKTYVLNKTIIFSDGLVSIEDRIYNFKSGVPFLSLETKQRNHLWGGHRAIRTVQHLLSR